MRQRIFSGVNGPGFAVIAACIGLWELYARTLGSQFDSIAPSSATLIAIKDLLFDGPLLAQAWHTTSIALAGWIMASALGFAFGASIGVSNLAWTYSMASFDVLRSIPSISFIPVA